ncbi:TPA: signal recognition particle-docking protein FtsY [archaeon]|uniref:Signal recognition particle receptor FtsY n=1 Tax=Candidatus Naiadarchaeum limnaeum TaxID=2756139 RepID=A0A832URJ0_9ARCH|nr:signal recognition particle-docking protein FtsY [Candidatus Naiadarchaeum limnaeum]
MFENLKKKLKGFFSKSSEQIEQKPAPALPEEIKPQDKAEGFAGTKEDSSFVEPDPQTTPAPALPPEITEPDETEEQILEDVKRELEKQGITQPPDMPEVKEEKIPTAEEKAEEMIEGPKLPLPEDIEIVTVEPEEKKPPPEIEVIKIHEKPKEVLRELKAEIEEVEEKPGIFKLFSKITHKELGEKDLDPILWELEIALLENDVAKEVAEKICAQVKESLLAKKAKRGTVEEIIKSTLKNAVNTILSAPSADVLDLIAKKKEKPFVIIFFGFNGTGKTLTIGKFAKLLLDNNYSVVMAAGDTFRAAAIEQLEVHAKKLKVPIIKQKKGADSAAVIFDAIKHAKAKGIEVVLADTAGRSHTNINLMDELKKIVRVNNPDLKIFVGDSLTGNDAAEQAKLFNDAVGIDASVLTKIDTDPKGGACLSVAYTTNKPILYLGTGQKYEDMIPFSAKWFVEKVF